MAGRKGLPYIKIEQDVPHYDYKVDLHGIISVKYKHMLYFIFLVGLTFLIYPIQVLMNSNQVEQEHIKQLGSIFVYIYGLDLLTKIGYAVLYNERCHLFRPVSIIFDTCSFIFTLFIPYLIHDPIAHALWGMARDWNYAVICDLLRIFLWPDNTQQRKRVANFEQVFRENGPLIWINFIKTPILRALVEIPAIHMLILPNAAKFSWQLTFFFPVKLIVFEVVTDFFYYWLHRACHLNKGLYAFIHKLHHTTNCPTAINASTMTYIETFVTFALANLFVPWLLRSIVPLTLTEFSLIICWFASIEIMGHSGLVLPMNEHSVWRYGMSGILSTLGIKLMVKDHELHHWNATVNFGKRTQCWDKLFGTYDESNLERCAEACLEDTAKPKRS